MSIVATEIESIHGDINKRMLFYRCQDQDGVWHKYGPVITVDQLFDAEAHKSVVATKVLKSLADEEASNLIGDA